MKQAVAIMSVILYFSFFNSVRANVVISEILYSPTTGQWIEIYNDTDSSIDLTKYKILDSGASTNGHGISAVLGGTNLVPAHNFAVIAKAPDNFGTVSFLLFKSSLGIKVSEDIVKLKNDTDAIIDSVSIDGSAIEGKSLQKISGTWQESVPTPGKENTPSVGNTNNEQNEQTEGSTTTSSSSISKSTKISQPSIEVEAILKNSVVFAGLGTKFQGKVSRYGEVLFYGRYFWNFGDGSSEEMKVNAGGEVSHIYFYPGEYALSLEYYVNDYGDPEASDSMIVKVIGADILISSVGQESDFFIELSNNTDKDVDIGKWMLTSGDKRFVFPKNTIISAKKKITFSPWVTGFTFSDKNNLKLVNPDWKTVFDYALSVIPPPPLVVVHNSKPKVTVARANVTNSAIAENVTTEFVNQVDASNTAEVSSTNLGAQAISSEVADSYNKGNIYYLILLVLLLAGGGAIYFIRRSNRQNLETTEDFEILDE